MLLKETEESDGFTVDQQAKIVKYIFERLGVRSNFLDQACIRRDNDTGDSSEYFCYSRTFGASEGSPQVDDSRGRLENIIELSVTRRK